MSNVVSQLAKADLDDLRAEGLAPSDEDIIRLHALALRISDGPETTAYNFPRFSIAGGVVFHEPTMAALMWYRYAKMFASDEPTADWMFAFACAKGRVRGFLDALRDPREIEKALGAFIASVAATKAEVDNAVYYAAVGNDSPDAEQTEMEKRKAALETPDERQAKNYAKLEKRLAQAAAATGLTFDDLMAQTPSRLRTFIDAAHVLAGEEMTPNAAAAHASYLATLDAIRKRLVAERDKAKEV